MRGTTLSIAVLLCVMLAAGMCAAGSIWDYEAVDSQGVGTHSLVVHVLSDGHFSEPTEKVTVEGVALAGMEELLSLQGPYGQYNAFIQDTTSDRGGLQVWAGSWFYGALWPNYRASYYRDFHAGDLLRVTGYLADANRGKVVINHLHSPLVEYAVQVEVIGHPGLPDPALIPSISHCNYFDQTRADGGERWQSRLVMLHGVEKTGGSWANGQSVTIGDSTGTVPMLLSAMGDFTTVPQPAGKFSVIGVFDQEDTVLPITENYRVWVKRSSDIAEALDCCRQTRSKSADDRVALVDKVVSRVFDGYFYVQDRDRMGGIRIQSSRAVSPGDVVAIQGPVSLTGDEVAVSPTYIVPMGSGALKPVFVTSPTLWADSGLDVDGLLVKCFAKIGQDQGDGIQAVTDDAGKIIFVRRNGVTVPAPGTPVAITGVLSRLGGVPLLELSSAGDVGPAE